MATISFQLYCINSNKIEMLTNLISPANLIFKGPSYEHGLTIIPAWVSNYMPGKMWDEITYPFLNFNGCTIEV